MTNLAENRKARYDYEILEKFEAGLALTGQEVKSLRNRGISLSGTYIIFKGNELFWVGANITPYQPFNTDNYDPQRDRKLLLHKEELDYLKNKTKEKGLTLVPLLVYTVKRKIKMGFVLARGKKKYDKRETIKKRDIERKIRNALKTRG